jgi:putative oxidoreductase
MRELLITDAPAATVLVRIMVGSVFLSEGIQKFLYSEELGALPKSEFPLPTPWARLSAVAKSFAAVC